MAVVLSWWVSLVNLPMGFIYPHITCNKIWLQYRNKHYVLFIQAVFCQIDIPKCTIFVRRIQLLSIVLSQMCGAFGQLLGVNILDISIKPIPLCSTLLSSQSNKVDFVILVRIIVTWHYLPMLCLPQLTCIASDADPLQNKFYLNPFDRFRMMNTMVVMLWRYHPFLNTQVDFDITKWETNDGPSFWRHWIFSMLALKSNVDLSMPNYSRIYL